MGRSLRLAQCVRKADSLRPAACSASSHQCETDGFLKAHGVLLDLTLEDVQQDGDTAIASGR